MRRGVVCIAVTLSLLTSGSGVLAEQPASGLVNKERAFVSGSVLSYAWLLGEPVHVGDLEGRKLAVDLYGDRMGGRRHVRDGYDILRVSGDDFSVWGASHDAVLEVGLSSKLEGYKATYGASFSLAVPGGTGGSIVGYGRGAVGSRAFLDTTYGNFSIGYQEGVESVLKVDVLNSLPGISGGSWGRHVMRFLKYSNDIPFHIHPGLYSENLFRSMAWKDASKDPFSTRFKDVVTTIPLRLSYISKNINGFRFGLSYSLAGYRDDLFKGGEFKVSDVVSSILGSTKRPENVVVNKAISLDKPRFDFGPVYKNVVSAALRYEVALEGNKVAFYAALEHGDARKYDKLAVLPQKNKFFVGYDELSAYSVGVEALYGGVLKVGMNYGYLGKSGRPKTLSTVDNIVRNVPYLDYKPSYYFASSVGYLRGPFSGSIMCFVSRLGYNAPAASPSAMLSDLKPYSVFKSLFDGENVLTDFVFGLGYDVYRKGKANVQMFVNCHVFSSSQRFNVHMYDIKSALNSSGGKVFNHTAAHKNAHSGVMAFGGLKFTF